MLGFNNRLSEWKVEALVSKPGRDAQGIEEERT